MFDTVIDGTLAFVRDNRDWAFWISLVFAMGETTPVISILLPSTAILLGIGALVASGELSLFPIWAGAAIGALIGSNLSYLLGWVVGPKLTQTRVLNRHAGLVEKGEAAFRRWGPLAIIVGHFFGPLRAVVFLMAGMARVKVPVFLAVNFVGCLAWAYVTPTIGEVGGHAIGWVWNLLSGA
jgi:membrane protein DedA with SNARE-associated domain